MIKLNIQKFAGSTFDFGASGYLQGRIVWSSSSNGSVANSSNVSATLQVHRTNSATTTGTWTGALNINGDERGWSWYGSISNGWVSVYSFTTTVGHNNDGTKVCYIGGSVRGPAGTSLSGNVSSGGANVGLDTIPRYATMTSASNFTDEQNPSFTYSNPAGLNNLNCWLEINPTGEHLAVRNITTTATSGTFTWNLTEEEKNQLRAKIPNNMSATCRIGLYSTLGGSTQASFKDVVFSIINGNPIFSNFEYEDINPTTLALTGDSSVNINGYSTIQATISTINKAEAIKSATMNKYRFVIGDKSKDIAYSSTQSVSGSIENAQNGTYQIYAIDSRNNSTLVSKLATKIIEYTPISLNALSCSVARNDNDIGEYAVLTLNGSIWNDYFDESQQNLNSIQSIIIEYKETGSSTWLTSPTTIIPTVSGNSFSFTGQVASQSTTFDLNKSYNFRITISDELSTSIIELVPMASGIPNISLADNGVGIMCDYDENKGGLLQIGGEVYDETYTTNEIKTNKKWLDNKPIYRKIYTNTDNNNADHAITDNIISELSIDNVINLKIIIKDNQGRRMIPYYYYNSGNNIDFLNCWIETDGKIHLRYGSSYPAKSITYYIFLEYTKTTD